MLSGFVVCELRQKILITKRSVKMNLMSALIAYNVLQKTQAGFRRFLCLPPTKGYIEDNCFFAAPPKMSVKRPNVPARARLSLFAVSTELPAQRYVLIKCPL